jgi:hypothetical protein
MKMKNDIAVIVVLLIICFIVIPLISQFFVKEGFYNLNTIEVNRVLQTAKFSDTKTVTYNTETRVNNTNDVSFTELNTLMLTKEDRPGQDISYNYCIGKLKCDSGYEMKRLPFKDNNNTNLFYPYCISGNLLKELKCDGGIKSQTREGDTIDSSGFTPNFSFNRYQTSDNPYYFEQYELNEAKTGLKWIKNIMECDYISDSATKIACHDSERQTREGSQSTQQTDVDYLKELFQAILRSSDSTSGSSSTSSSSSSSSSSGSSDAIKCIADFGTEKGEALCCGQTGVLQSTKYVCPNTLPYCSDFKCGSKFGTCRK